MTKKELHYEDLGISLSELYEQMGYGQTMPDETTQKETERITEEVKAFLKSRFCFFVQREMPGFSIGKIIERQLKGAEAYALFICTAGQKYEDYMHRLKEEGDMVRVFIADALGSVIEQLTEEWARKGDYATNLGTQVHAVMEYGWQKKNYNFDKSLNESFPEMEEDFDFRKGRCKELFTKMKKVYVPIANEFIVYDQENGICRNY